VLVLLRKKQALLAFEGDGGIAAAEAAAQLLI